MKWRSILAILMMVGGLSTQAYAVVVLETDDNLAVLTGTVDTARFMTQIAITSTATWCIQARWTNGSNRTTAAQYQVFDGPTLRATFTANQQVNGGAWRHLGCVKLTAGNTGEVRISNAGVSTSNIVVADGVRWVWDERPLFQDFCVAVNGGFGSPGGTTFVGKEFISPTVGTCKPWAGIVKTASTVVGTSTGGACLSNDGKLLTITVHTTDPQFFGTNGSGTDHIELCPLASTQGCPASSGQFDHGSFSGPAAQVTCTTAVSSIPSTHD
jgi:hypothetical protein